MQIKVGVDIIEVERIKQSIEELGEDFAHRVFTDKEIKYCEGKKVNKYQHYAGRFAAKEAAFKAVSGLLRPDNGDITDGEITFMGSRIDKKDAAEILVEAEKLQATDAAKVLESGSGKVNRSWVEKTLTEKGFEIIDDIYRG